MHTPESCYSFSYELGTARFVFDITAVSQADAEARVAAMASARCLGAITESTACAAHPTKGAVQSI